MSTDYAIVKKVSAQELFDGRLEEYGVREHIVPNETTHNNRCFTDGNNYMWVHIKDDGFVSSATSYFPGGTPAKILRAIAKAFDTNIFSEHQPQYWGFDTLEEWDAASEEMAREDREKFYTELLKYVRGESNDFQPGTVGMGEAEIAKTLVENDPELLLLINKDKLLNQMDPIYKNKNSVKSNLSRKDRMLILYATHEDDLPRA